MGVKQGCVMAPVIFNLFLVAVTMVFRNWLFDTDRYLGCIHADRIGRYREHI